jgi:hydroxymethylglutaryl-CoA synthase
MNVGIDKIGLYVPRQALDMKELALHRGVDPNKYVVGIGQRQMAVVSPAEDIVTMALEAASQVVEGEIEQIDSLYFATETGMDFSKSAGNHVHRMLGLKPSVRSVEFKQACYAATGALQMACEHVRLYPDKKVLVISSDIAWYGFNTPGEATQGAGAVALLVSANPRLALVRPGRFVTEELADFYRPSYVETPIVDGRFSVQCYTNLLKQLDPHQAYPYVCFHMPFATMADKANHALAHPIAEDKLKIVKDYTAVVGNIYNGSLYLSLLSVLANASEDLSNQTIPLFSYGSGAIAEWFDVKILPTYRSVFDGKAVNAHLENRATIDVAAYEHDMATHARKEKAETYHPSAEAKEKTPRFCLEAIEKHHRRYTDKQAH